MKRIYFITVILLIFFSSVQGQVMSYKPGEKVTYTIQYGFITAGIGVLGAESVTL